MSRVSLMRLARPIRLAAPVRSGPGLTRGIGDVDIAAQPDKKTKGFVRAGVRVDNFLLQT
jgi:hypothetical protein